MVSTTRGQRRRVPQSPRREARVRRSTWSRSAVVLTVAGAATLVAGVVSLQALGAADAGGPGPRSDPRAAQVTVIEPSISATSSAATGPAPGVTTAEGTEPPATSSTTTSSAAAPTSSSAPAPTSSVAPVAPIVPPPVGRPTSAPPSSGSPPSGSPTSKPPSSPPPSGGPILCIPAVMAC